LKLIPNPVLIRYAVNSKAVKVIEASRRLWLQLLQVESSRYSADAIKLAKYTLEQRKTNFVCKYGTITGLQIIETQNQGKKCVLVS
jgi:hypothetical protein